jgi:hypothetical protein
MGRSVEGTVAMRYFGKDGPQCAAPALEPGSAREVCRQVGRAVLFGRVPRAASLWLGAGLLLVLLALGALSVCSLQEGGFRACRDTADVVAIRR